MPISNRARVFALLAATAGLAACSDTPTAAPDSAPALPNLGVVGRVAQRNVGDTTVTTFTLVPGRLPTPIHLGNDNKIDIPDGATSICAIATSSYGPREWDRPCTPETGSVTITAKTWIDANGLAQSDFQPALRFVPNDARPVMLYLKNRNGHVSKAMRINYCTGRACVNEAIADPSVATQIDQRGRTAYRRIKHFSGYMVSVGLAEENSDSTHNNSQIQ